MFRPSPTEPAALPSQYSFSQGQMEATFVTPTVPVKSRPIRLVCNGHPVSPMPSSQSLSGQLPEETARAWWELGTQYVTEYSNSAAPVTLASAGISAGDQDIVELRHTP